MNFTPEQRKLIADLAGNWPLVNNGKNIDCGFCHETLIFSVLFKGTTVAAKTAQHIFECPEYAKLLDEAEKTAPLVNALYLGIHREKAARN